MVDQNRGGYQDLAGGESDIQYQVKQSDYFIDLGQTGLKRTSGIIDEEFLPALKGRKAIKIYNEMWRNNSTVSSLIFAITHLLSQVKWTVVSEDRTPEGEEAVQFLESVMDDMSQSWSDTIEEILTCTVFGWSYHEIVYKRRVGPWEKKPSHRSKYTDGLIGWRKLPIRAQETLHRWVFDKNGGIQGMVQIAAPNYEQRYLPVEKCLLFRVGTHKNSPEGVSLLRGSYRPWYWLKRMEEMEAIAVERDMAGMPVARIPARLMNSKNPEDKKMFEAFKKLVKDVRRDEHNGLVIPSDVHETTKHPLYDFELMSSSGSHTMDTSNIIQRLKTEILSAVLADFIMLGTNTTGSYAMHVDKTGIFRQALNSIIETIADVFNRHAIPRLFEMNSWKPDELPKFKPSPVENPNLAELASFMSSMASLGEQWFPDPNLSKFVRDIANIPEMSNEKEQALSDQEEQSIQDGYMDAALASQQKEQQLQAGAQGPQEQQPGQPPQQPEQQPGQQPNPPQPA